MPPQEEKPRPAVKNKLKRFVGQGRIIYIGVAFLLAIVVGYMVLRYLFNLEGQ
jgi:hypothetical protein